MTPELPEIEAQVKHKPAPKNQPVVEAPPPPAGYIRKLCEDIWNSKHVAAPCHRVWWRLSASKGGYQHPDFPGVYFNYTKTLAPASQQYKLALEAKGRALARKHQRLR